VHVLAAVLADDVAHGVEQGAGGPVGL
jgi:hypothetical protein